MRLSKKGDEFRKQDEEAQKNWQLSSGKTGKRASVEETFLKLVIMILVNLSL